MEENMKQSLTAAALAVGAIASVAAASAKDVTIPKGTYLELKSASAFDSELAIKGDTFTATVIRGLWVDGQLAIPSGSTVTGTIKSVRSPRDGAKSAAVGVKFESLSAGGGAATTTGASRRGTPTRPRGTPWPATSSTSGNRPRGTPTRPRFSRWASPPPATTSGSGAAPGEGLPESVHHFGGGGGEAHQHSAVRSRLPRRDLRIEAPGPRLSSRPLEAQPQVRERAQGAPRAQAGRVVRPAHHRPFERDVAHLLACRHR